MHAGMTKLLDAFRHLCLAKTLQYSDQRPRKRTKVEIYVTSGKLKLNFPNDVH